MYENYHKQQQTQIVNSYLESVKNSSMLIHELQRERGLSASYLGDKNPKTKDKLQQQRKKTDLAINNYIYFLNKVSTKKHSTNINILEKIHTIKAFRVKFDNEKVNFEKEMEFYSSIINQLISYIQDKPTQDISLNFLNDFEALLSLINLKEYAGIERAYFANIFAKNQLTLKQLKDVQQAILKQDLYYQNFIKYAPQNIYSLYKEKIPYQLEMKLKTFRNIVLNSHLIKNFGIDSLTWYHISTQRIDNIYLVLTKLLNTINQQAKQNEQDARVALTFSIILWILSIIAFLYIWYTIYYMIKIEETTIKQLENQQKNYNAMTHLSNSIAYIDNEIALYLNLCKALLNIEGFSDVWIAKVDNDKKLLKPIVSNDIEIHKLEKIIFDLSSNNNTLPTPIKAYQKDNYVISNKPDISKISQCQTIIDNSILSIASFPIYLGKNIVSILTIFSTKKDIFDKELIELIDKLLKDTSRSLEFLNLRENEQKILEELNIASYAFESQEAIAITDANANIIKVNKAFEDITGYRQEDVLGKNPSVLKSEKQSSDFYAKMWSDLKRYGKWKGEIYNKRKTGEVYPELLSITAIKNNKNAITHFVAHFLDISRIKKLQQEAEFRADHDPLTSLTNRSKLKIETEKAFLDAKKQGVQHAFFFLDIDNFKYINDFYGHATGDAILIEIASRLKKCTKENDIVARLGGDEFAMLSLNIGKEEFESIQQATQIAKIIQKVMKDSIYIDGHPFDITFSIGVKIFPSHENGYEEVISHADIAMYKAKKSGKNKFAFFDTELDIELKQFSLLEKEIKQALINRE